MPTSLRPRLLVRLRLLPVDPPAGVSVGHDAHDAQQARAPADAAMPVDDDAASACGWYDSSFALREGLAVSELDDGADSLAAFGFALPSAVSRPTPVLQ